MDITKHLLKKANNEFASIVSDGVIGDNQGFIDTGSYSLNALFSGSIYGGLPSNKISALAGESGVGKTFYCLQCCKSFLEDNPEGIVLYFETESALTKQMFQTWNIDTRRIAMIPVDTIQSFRHQCLNVLKGYADLPVHDRKPMLVILDSLGNLSTTKEIEDIAEGKETRDMTRTQLIRGAFRVLTLNCGKLNVPMLVTNHVYQTMDQYSGPVMSGGGGLVYAASSIAMLSKAKEREGSDIVGAIITARLMKGRLTKEQKSVKTRLFHDRGLDRYYGLLDIAEKYGIFKKVSTRIELPDGTKVWGKQIVNNPEKYYTKEILNRIDEACRKEFCYGSDPSIESAEIEPDNRSPDDSL